VTYLQRKMMLFVITLWAAITLNFALPRLMPGSPVDAALAKLASSGVPVTNAEVHAIQVQLGVPNTSLFSQYFSYLKNIATLNFGTSYSFPTQTVAATIGKALPWTLVLVGTSTIVAFVIGTLLGVYAGWRRGRSADAVVTLGSTLFAAFPPVYAMAFSGFYIAIMLVLWGLILRAVALEFHARDEHRGTLWDLAFHIGSLLPAWIPWPVFPVAFFGAVFIASRLSIGSIICGVPARQVSA